MNLVAWMSLNVTYRDISNLLIWMCIREIIFIKREKRTLVCNAFLISCVWSLNSISLRLSNSLIYVSVQLPIFMHPLTGWTSFLLYNHPRWTRYMFCIQIDKIKCISFSPSRCKSNLSQKNQIFSTNELSTLNVVAETILNAFTHPNTSRRNPPEIYRTYRSL